jgi:hypothetical protein
MRFPVAEIAGEVGGVFDLNRNWINPHCSHRKGTDADLRTNHIPYADSVFIDRWWRLKFGRRSVVAEGGNTPHTHVKTPR